MNMHTHTRTYIHMHTHTRTHIHMHTHTRAHIHVHMGMCAHTQARALLLARLERLESVEPVGWAPLELGIWQASCP